MKNFNTIKSLACAFTFATILFAQAASAQKYKTAADTVKLNQKYAELTLDIAKLNYKLIEEKSKTEGYEAKTVSTAQDASSGASSSKATAATATNGDLGDAKKAMKQARKANNQANDARDAMDDKTDNVKKITKLNEKIADKQKELVELDKQKAAILLI